MLQCGWWFPFQPFLWGSPWSWVVVLLGYVWPPTFDKKLPRAPPGGCRFTTRRPRRRSRRWCNGSARTPKNPKRKNMLWKTQKTMGCFCFGCLEPSIRKKISLLYSSHKPWLKWKWNACIKSLKMLGFFLFFLRMWADGWRAGRRLRALWEPPLLWAAGRHVWTVAFWRRPQQRPGRCACTRQCERNWDQKGFRTDVIHLCFNNSSEIGLWQFVVHGSMKGFEKRLESMPNLKRQ